jgi:hypothetical protein
VPGKSIVLPKSVDLIKVVDIDLDMIRKKYLHNQFMKSRTLTKNDISFLVEETNSSVEFVMTEGEKYNIKMEDENE